MFRRSPRLASRRPQPYRTRLLLQGLEERAVPATLIDVTSTADAGPGTLRQALLDANSEISPFDGADTITFTTVTGTITLTTGELLASKAVVINGPGASSLTIKQTTANSRVLRLDNLLTGGEVFEVSGLTLTGGQKTVIANADRGGGVALADETVTLTNCVITGNAAAAGGGGISATGATAATLNLVNCTVTNNSAIGAGSDGGGIRLSTGQTLTLNKCTITGNVATDDGAGVYVYKTAGLTATDTTIASNRGLSFVSDGGGVRLGQVATGPISFTNCTIANNVAVEYGGGVDLSLSFTGIVDFKYCTIVGNTANLNGGGIAREATAVAGVTINLEGTVVAENTGFVNPDFYAVNGTTINLTNSAIGNLEGWIATTGASVVTPGTPLRLGSLANNGGPVPTILPAPGSPLVNLGGVPGAPVFDARGIARVTGGSADIGAAETVGTEAVAQLAAPLALVERPGGTSYTVTVTYTDDTAVKFSTISAANLTVTGPPGVTVALGTVTPAADAKTITATYLLTPPGGSWDINDNGTYTISLANNVQDASGALIPTTTLGQIAVAVGTAFLVTTDAATGAGSLAQAVADAQTGTLGLTDVIRFDSFFATARTINLTTPITITDTLYIEGPGKDLLSVRPALANDRVFITNDGSASKFSNITFAGMTIRDGAPAAGVGGGVQIDTEWVSFRDVRITGNKSAGRGAGVGVLSAGSGVQSGKVLIYNSEVTNNTVTALSDGGAVGFQGNSVNNYLLIKDSLISGNTANRRGSVFYGINAAVLVEGSLLTGNQAGGAGASYGGTLMFYGSGRSSVIRNSTITSNKTVGAASGGGAAVMTNGTFSGTVGIYNSTLSNNTSASKGGAISRLGATGFVVLVNSIVDGNTAPTGPDINGAVVSFESLISNSAGSTITDVGATSLLDVSANLSPLYNFGGTQKGYATLPGSPARESGIVIGHPFDQRGAGFPRVVDAPDMGALEFGASTPIPTIGALPAVTTLGVPDYTLTITYNDDVGIDVATVGDDDVRVTGPGGYDVLAKFVSGTGPLTAYAATYQVLAPGGSWDFSENGFYTVSVVAGKVADTSLNAVPAVAFGSFTVGLPQTLIVTNANDAGNGSLRAALATANAAVGGTTINFDVAFFSTPRTITLTTGELLVANNVIMNGPGADSLTISGNNAGRILTLSNAASVISLTISGMTLRDGKLFKNTENGGAILNSGENLTLSKVTVTNNGTAGDGGAINCVGGSFNFDDSKAIGNSATGGGGDGGFAFVGTACAMSMARSTVSGNYSFDGGGGMYISGTSTLTATDCTISGNVADSAFTANGGGVYLGSAANGTFTNCTISGNSAGLSGGGIRFNSGTLTLNSSTVANNIARNVINSSVGGGIYRVSGGSGDINLNGSVVADNAVLNGGSSHDIFAGNVNVADSAVFDLNGFTATGTYAVLPGTPLLLGPLANNGGATLTHLPAPTSPLRDAGGLVGSTTNDQRGTGFARLIGTKQDVGATESDGTQPVGILTPVANVTTAGGTVLQFQVTYYDDGTINLLSLDGNDIRITGANGFDVPASFVSSLAVPGGVEATYQFTPPGGTWNSPDAGSYSIAVQANQVTDNSSKAVTAATLGGFKVQLARNYVVLNANESGVGSLRQAVLDSNANQVASDVDTITFDSVFFATAKTITLATGDLVLSDSVKIFGPGAKLLTISTTGFHRHFTINGLGSLTFQIEDMTLTGGRAFGADAVQDAGGSVFVDNDNVTFNRMVFSNNSSINSGGAIFPSLSPTVITINDSLLVGNSGGNGGAIRLPGTNTVTAVNTTFSGNTASSGGGAISNNGGFLTLTNCTLAFNTAVGATGGGGLRQILGTATLDGTLVTNNLGPVGPDISGAVAVTANDSLIGNSAGANTTGSNLLMDVDAKIAPLADNGGPTRTHAIPNTSPAFNAGSNLTGLLFDQRGAGFDRTKLGGTDIGAFELQSLAVPPTLTTIKVNGGAVQRSLVTNITVTFSEAVTFPSGIAAAFAVSRTGPGGPTGTVNLVLTPSGNDVLITFTTGGAVGIETGKSGSLIDGNYSLTVNADKISGVGGTLDGNGNGIADGSPTDDRSQAFHRLFGDADGDKDVDNTDFVAFRTAFGTGATIFDADGDGDTDNADFVTFRTRFGTNLP